MEEFAIDLRSSAVTVVERSRLSFRDRVAAYAELTKPRITFLIVLTSAAGFALASKGAIDYVAMFRALLGIALLSSGIATLNQYAERELDGLMRRTATDRCPQANLRRGKRWHSAPASRSSLKIYLLLLVNPLSALLGLTVIAGYLFAYTPLKTRTTLSTLVGAFPGAVPPLIGWTAAHGNVESRRLDTVCDSVSLAVSTLSRDRVDVSRRLQSRRHPDAAGGRTRRPRHRATDRRLHVDVVAGEFIADVDGNVRQGFISWGNRARTAISLQQSARGILDVTATCAPLVAGISTLLAAAVYLDGFE